MSPALGRVRRVGVCQSKLFAAIETNLIRPAFDGEDPAQVAMTTAEGKLENPTQRVHRSYNRAWRENVALTTICSPLFEGHSLTKRRSPAHYPMDCK
jgi:hypothetical protein